MAKRLDVLDWCARCGHTERAHSGGYGPCLLIECGRTCALFISTDLMVIEAARVTAILRGRYYEKRIEA